MIIYLYKKTHNITGLMYLGKTISKNPHKYKGSGDIWIPHIKKYGYDVSTEILKECHSIDELKYWGKYYSDLWQIVESSTWANLKPEEGDGFPSGDKNPQKQEHNRIKSSKKMKEQYETVWKNDPENKKMRSLWGKKGAEFMKSTEGRILASSKTQSKNPNYDHTILTFEHTEANTQFTGTMYDFRTKFMLRQSSVSLVVAGKRQTVSGWKLVTLLSTSI